MIKDIWWRQNGLVRRDPMLFMCWLFAQPFWLSSQHAWGGRSQWLLTVFSRCNLSHSVVCHCWACLYVIVLEEHMLSENVNIIHYIKTVLHIKIQKDRQCIPLFHYLTLNNDKWVIHDISSDSPCEILHYQIIPFASPFTLKHSLYQARSVWILCLHMGELVSLLVEPHRTITIVPGELCTMV